MVNLFRLALATAVIVCSLGAQAEHRFNIEISNVSGQNVEMRGVSINAKGPGLDSLCNYGQGAFPVVESGKKTGCIASGHVKNWRRTVSVTFFCQNSNMVGTQTYPRNGSWFNRNHLSSSGNKYKVAIKRNDC